MNAQKIRPNSIGEFSFNHITCCNTRISYVTVSYVFFLCALCHHLLILFILLCMCYFGLIFWLCDIYSTAWACGNLQIQVSEPAKFISCVNANLYAVEYWIDMLYNSFISLEFFLRSSLAQHCIRLLSFLQELLKNPSIDLKRKLSQTCNINGCVYLVPICEWKIPVKFPYAHIWNTRTTQKWCQINKKKEKNRVTHTQITLSTKKIHAF